MADDTVPDDIRYCLENTPAILHALECLIEAWETAGRLAAERTGGNDELFDVVMDRMGAHELGEVLEVMCGRLANAVGDSVPVQYRRDQAAALVALYAGWHSPARSE